MQKDISKLKLAYFTLPASTSFVSITTLFAPNCQIIRHVSITVFFLGPSCLKCKIIKNTELVNIVNYDARYDTTTVMTWDDIAYVLW